MAEPILYVNGQFVPKSQALISVYDSGFQHGDAVYEGIRVYDGRIFMLDEHVNRLYESAKAIGIDIGISQVEMREIVLDTLRANEFRDSVHIRLQVTRGKKRITGMNPSFNDGPASIVVCLDYKGPIFRKDGIQLITSRHIRSNPWLIDSKIHTTNQLHQVLASIEANRQNADEAIMLDPHGFVAETNGTNIFMIKRNKLFTPTVNYILVGITRGIILDVARELEISTCERDLSITEFYNADEVFICGTVGEIVPVAVIDGMQIGCSVPGPITLQLVEKYSAMTKTMGVPIDEA